MGLFSVYNYLVVIALIMIGLYAMIARGNLVKKMIGLGIFQASVLLLYLSMGKVDEGTSPIIVPGETVYTNPVPHVLMLTAIVVGVATLAVGLSIIVRLKESYGTIEEDEILEIERKLAESHNKPAEPV